jgi:DNA-binding SARP family transcriptional activator
MARISERSPQLGERDRVHPREYEHQATYRAYLFGQFRLFCGSLSIGQLLRRRTKARQLLKWFLLNPGKLCSADEFIDLFWPDISPETALGNFHVTMHYLRRVLEPALNSRQEPTYVRRKPNNFYWFQMDESWWIDASDLQMLFERARNYELLGDEQRAAFYYRKIAWYCSQGFLAEDEAESWLLPYRRRYNHMYAQSLGRLVQIYTRAQELEEVLEYAYQLLLIEPCHEEATRAIVDAHLQQGNVSIAQRRLDAFCQALQRDLGLRPPRDFYLLRERVRAASG